MRVTQQQGTLYLEVLLAVGGLFAGTYFLVSGGPLTDSLILYVGAALVGVLIVATRRGWRHAPVALILLMTVVLGSAPSSPTLLDSSIIVGFLLPPLVAMIVGYMAWIPISALMSPAVFLVSGSYASFLLNQHAVVYAIYMIAVACMMLGRAVTDTALSDARLHAQHAISALKLAEAQTEQLEAAKAQQAVQLNEQQQLLDLVATLETPTATLADDVLFAPIVGVLDQRRTHALTKRLLDATYSRRVRLVILDVAGVALVDSATADALLATAQALRLLGCNVTISGISAAVAQTLTAQGIHFADIATVRSPQEALANRAQLI